MSLSVEQIYNDAMQLPDESKVSLAERLVEYLEKHVEPGLESYHINTAKKRRDEVRSGLVQPIDGEDALARVRGLLRK